ncbi:MAG TPA: uracil-DNA glycosylase family protein, partial [Gaiellaceae bacterium]|nr:uracil-DNA glycosylase family protein [Gaiellaceae bacterium]
MAGRDTTPSDVPDVLAADLRIVFVGINPGRVSAAARAHFANPRNDFWRLLHAAGLTSRLYEPREQFALLEEGIGVTNAAYRTTPGSGDLRRADFAGSAERLGQIARELRPSWLAFVGKEAYRGAFGRRPELGLQEQALGEARLFVLPSTSPANAAVPWQERLRWFRELAGRASGLPLRESVRAAVIDGRGRILLLRYGDQYSDWWMTPGGAREPGEGDEQTLRRELEE